MELADYYRLLGLRTGASYEDIKASYRRLARRYHPDANPTNQQQAQDRFIQLTEAYKALSSLQSPVAPDATPPASVRRSPEAKPPETQASQTQASQTRPTAKPPIKVTVTKTSSQRQSASQSPQVQFQNLSLADQKLKSQSYQQLQQLLKQQRFPRAVALTEGLAQRLPHDAEVRQWQAITYQRFGRYLIGNRQSEKARVYLKKALRIDPHNKSLWYEVERDFRRIEQIEIY
ncbi:MAG: J domain-containing protein [Pegethrix bostrychoides GSE-TBD4-15B]|jgi:curved DNA-binding protein CbpA|uniref:J domain-containing protein n=1 Tax=Pegethrix bostrychoides GSE-TBD4-15B TaxID=2839662 RepID=A0A951PAW0_9CYAN|nr:J domain-containing protein [Pegethrix bostrychoides GSE-TBD4-15B]